MSHFSCNGHYFGLFTYLCIGGWGAGCSHACPGIDLMLSGLSESTFNPTNHPTSIFTVVRVVEAWVANRWHKCCGFNKLLRDSPFTQLALVSKGNEGNELFGDSKCWTMERMRARLEGKPSLFLPSLGSSASWPLKGPLHGLLTVTQ